jgi:hypothetical protein
MMMPQGITIYKVLSESSQSVIVVTASVKEDEKGGQGHTSASLLHQSATRHCAVNTQCFYMNAFSMDGKIKQYVCIKFCVKLSVHPLPKPLKCSMRLLKTFFKLDSGF